MEFKDFIAEGNVKRISKDLQLVKSLVKTADSDIIFFKELEINTNSARKIFSNFYDILRSILEAIAILDGYKIYSHEAFTYYLLEKGEEKIANRFDRFRKIRNKINYYGRTISSEEVIEHVPEIIDIIEKLKNKYLSKLDG